MIRIGIVIIVAAIIISIGVAIAFYIEYQPNIITVNAGEPVQVGPVNYIVTHIGEHNGNKDNRPENTFFQIQIIVENTSDGTTRLTGGQFYILSENNVKHQAVFVNFSDVDLFNDILEPNIPVTWETQFDIPYDENMKYNIGILPSKAQASRDIGIVCVRNCE